MKFTKMHGAGNDYIYINGFTEDISVITEERIRKMSDRHFGIGSDGVVIILPSETCDFKMRMFNSDGSEAGMCGNASRCVGKYVYEKGLTRKKDISLETGAGIKKLHMQTEDGVVKTITVDMGEPVLNAAEIPAISEKLQIVNEPIKVNGETLYITCVSMGNPHTIVFVNDVDLLEIEKTGSAIEIYPMFPRRTNVEFAEVVSRDLLKMRVWERGAGETLACGTGACASLVAGVINNKCNREATLKLLGGDLKIKWDNINNHVFMTGDATFVFEGEIKL